MDILVCAVLAVAFWLIPGPIAFEWIQVSGRRLAIRPRLAHWVGHAGYRWRRFASRFRRNGQSSELVFVTTAHNCPGGCGRVIGSGYLLIGDYWFRDLVTPHVCGDCAKEHALRLLRSMAEDDIRVTRKLRYGDLLRLRIELSSNRILDDRGRRVAVIVDREDEGDR